MSKGKPESSTQEALMAELPPLPEVRTLGFETRINTAYGPQRHAIKGYTADQMKDYGRECRGAVPAAAVGQTDERAKYEAFMRKNCTFPLERAVPSDAYIHPAVYWGWRVWEHLVAAPGAAPSEAPKPVAFMWQHEETGNVGFVDPWQVENGWQAANPRLKIVSPLYATPIASSSVERKEQP
jgi:hypothetical protein